MIYTIVNRILFGVLQLVLMLPLPTTIQQNLLDMLDALTN